MNLLAKQNTQKQEIDSQNLAVEACVFSIWHMCGIIPTAIVSGYRHTVNQLIKYQILFPHII
jgi:hypothetical protein